MVFHCSMVWFSCHCLYSSCLQTWVLESHIFSCGFEAHFHKLLSTHQTRDPSFPINHQLKLDMQLSCKMF